MTNNKGKKILSVTLSLAMLLSAIPLTALSSYAETENGVAQPVNKKVETAVEAFVAPSSEAEKEAAYAEEIAAFETQAVKFEATSSDGLWLYQVLEDGTAKLRNSHADNAAYTGKATDVVVPSEIDGYTVTVIGEYAFGKDSAAVNVIIPDTVTLISPFAFYQSKNISYVKVGDGVKEIGTTSFAGSSLERIDFGENVESLSVFVFQSCRSLKTVNLNDKLKELLHYTFENCTSLETITIPKSVERIEMTCFSGCSGLKSINVAQDNERFSSIDGVVFNKDATELEIFLKGKTCEVYEIPDGVETIKRNAFNKCNGVEEVVIADSVTTIEPYAFSEMDSLKTLSIPDGITELPNDVINKCSALEELVIGDGITDLDWIDFGTDTKNVKRVTLGAGIIEIPENKFNCASNLESIVMSDNVTTIGEGAFCYCEMLTEVTFSNSLVSIGNSAFSGTNIEELILPETTTYIGDYAFEGCPSLKTVEISENIETIGEGAFVACLALESIEVAEANENYCTEDGVLFTKDKSELIAYPAGKTDETYEIPDTVETIAAEAFVCNESLKSVVIPDSVTEIGPAAFASCYELVEVNIPNSITVIEDSTFSECISLTSITIPDSVEVIAPYAFSYCESLSEVILPENLSEIGEYAFSECPALENITIPESVTEIGGDVFAGSENVIIHAPEGSAAAQYAEENGIEHDDNIVTEAPADDIETVTSGDVTIVINKTARTVEITGEGAMEEPLYKYLVTKEHYLESIKGAMEGYYGTEVDLEYDETLTDILAIDDNLKYYDHATGEELVIDEDVRKAINTANFLEVSPIRITVGEGITSISDYAFVLCNDVEEVVLPSTVQTIGDGAFLYCGNLKRVILPEDVIIGESAFNYCHKLSLVVLATDDYYAPAPQNDGPMMILDEEPTSTNLSSADVYRLIYC